MARGNRVAIGRRSGWEEARRRAGRGCGQLARFRQHPEEHTGPKPNRIAGTELASLCSEHAPGFAKLASVARKNKTYGKWKTISEELYPGTRLARQPVAHAIFT